MFCKNEITMKNILDFLKELKENNNREWFEANKGRYLEVKKTHEEMLDKVIDGISTFDPVTGRPATKDCLFRIYRDVRFSPNKEPYKTHIGAFISRGGRKSERPGYYIHLEPGNCFMGGGVYMPQPENLKKIRNEIYFNAGSFKKIFEEKSFKQHFKELYDDKLSRPPKDFDPAFADIDLLKYKSYFVEEAYTDEEVLGADYVKKVVEACKALVPLNVFLNKAFE